MPQESSGSYKNKLTSMIIFLNEKKVSRGGTGRRSTGPTGSSWPGSCAGSEPAKPGSVWPRSTDILLPQLSNNRGSWKASPSYWRWWLAELASWRALLVGRARPRRSCRSCSPPWQGWAAWRSWWVGGDLSSLKEQVEQAWLHLGQRQGFKWS